MLFGVFGLYATLKDNYAFLFGYSGFMSIIFLVQFVTGVVALGVKDSSKFPDYVTHAFEPEFKVNSTNEAERDFYQEKFDCCGWNGPTDYYFNDVLSAPLSCCKIKNDECKGDKLNLLKTTTCNYKLMDASRGVIGVVGGVLLSFSIINFFSILLSVFMARKIRSGYQYTS
jgi:hypothetical protein